MLWSVIGSAKGRTDRHRTAAGSSVSLVTRLLIPDISRKCKFLLSRSPNPGRSWVDARTLRMSGAKRLLPHKVSIVYFVNQYGSNLIFAWGLRSPGILFREKLSVPANTYVTDRTIYYTFSWPPWMDNSLCLLRRTTQKNENPAGYFHASRGFRNLVTGFLVS